jgi:hypothetical protein
MSTILSEIMFSAPPLPLAAARGAKMPPPQAPVDDPSLLGVRDSLYFGRFDLLLSAVLPAKTFPRFLAGG